MKQLPKTEPTMQGKNKTITKLAEPDLRWLGLGLDSKPASRKWQYWVSVAGLILSIIMVVLVVFHWSDIGALAAYGYLGAFIISLFGGATVVAPIPMLPTVFALGTVMKPAFAPYLGPLFVGIAAGLGDTIGGMTIYMTGCGGVALGRSNVKFKGLYARLENLMSRRGSLFLFLVSAVVNPFFYPVALSAGALRYSSRKFFLISGSGKILKQISVAAAGYWGLGSLLRAFGLPF